LDQGINIQAYKVFLCGVTGPGEVVASGFVLKLEVRADTAGSSFSWVVADGWGDYADLAGNGHGYGVWDGPDIDDYFTGKLR
jgi:hypothetical protein